MKAFYKRLHEYFGRRYAGQLGLTPISDSAAEDIFIAGYPKSGNTWFQNLAAGALYGLDPALTPDAVIQRLVPDVHYLRYYKRFQTPMLFKTHHLPRPAYRRVVYLLRDGRDVLVSYYRHLLALHGGEEVDFMAMVRQGTGLFPGKWADHVQQWQANPYQVPLLTIRYEDLQQDAAGELARFCEFAGFARDPALLARVAAGASFAKMQAKEARFGVDNPLWPKEKPFVRRGAVGAYKDEMPPEILEAFIAEAGPVLTAVGYEV